MSAAAEAMLGRIVERMTALAPSFDLTAADVQGWASRQRGDLLPMVEAYLASRGGNVSPGADIPPDEWTPRARTDANLLAMDRLAELVAGNRPRNQATADDRRVLAGYSGWGGLSIEAAAPRFPAGIPHPDPQGLIHEYFTPTRVAQAVASAVLTRLDTLPRPPGEAQVRALEPSAGIGRFLALLDDPRLLWSAAELSPLSALLTSYRFPELRLRGGSFEGWAAEYAATVAGTLGLVVANPPYGPRGAERTDDPDPVYRGHRKAIYHYFLLRVTDLLARGGLSVWLVPMGLLHSRSGPTADLRRRLLLRQHVAAAFRLPSKLFPGAAIVTDLVFLRARGGELPGILPADEVIAEGRYYDEYPAHVLGTPVGADPEGETGKVGRRHYRIEGEFSALPDFSERPLDDATAVTPFVVGGGPGKKAGRARGGIARDEAEAGGDLSTLSEEVAAAVVLGQRTDRYLADVATGMTERARDSHAELTAALTAWRAAYGVPHEHRALRSAEATFPMLGRFLTAYRLDGRLAEAVAKAPAPPERRWRGRPDDLVGRAGAYYRDHRELPVAEFAREAGVVASRARDALTAAGWAIPHEVGDRSSGLLVPPSEYLTGWLWPKVDAARAAGDQRQTAALLDVIRPVQYEDIAGADPRMAWVPLDLLGEWLGSHNADGVLRIRVHLERSGGIVQLQGIRYGTMKVGDAHGSVESWRTEPKPITGIDDTPRWIAEAIGWLNHDYSLWKPEKRKDEDITVKRLAWEQEALDHFRGWVEGAQARKDRIAESYNRALRGFAAPSYPPEPISIARWQMGPKTRPHPWQFSGARRVLAHRGGIVAFDVGVGKTLTGLLVLGAARQEGWARRPVLLVPRSLLYKWEADTLAALPDYRVLVVGATSYTRRDGTQGSKTEDVEQQAQKWTRFQAGLYDVAICSYEAFGRIGVKASSLREYAERTAAIHREVKLAQERLAEKAEKKELTEREDAVLKHGIAGWLAEKLEPPPGQPYVPGITWEDLGVDLLIVDELQNFKNLYLPSPRGQAGVPKFMGSGGEGSNRAWGLDFRASLVRARTGGAGIVGLSATPAKNSPLEFYNAVQYIDHDAWTRIGIPDPETFIDRFIRVESQFVIEPSGDVAQKLAAVAFQNLDEIRDVLARYAEFQTAESVSEAYPDCALKLPEPESRQVYVEMGDEQAEAYETLRARAMELREAMRGGGSDARALAGALLGVMARMALVSLHQELAVGGWDWKTASDLSPARQVTSKFEALASRVRAQRGCGHIVFVENVAVHAWLRNYLAATGTTAEDRIGILNAEAAKDAARRVQIANEFNGDEFSPPKYDVVIANSVAYEGIDLQRRTCQIHHLDLPWEPATIQQRNGRGVRQGNTRPVIGIAYYLAKGSFDAIRFQMIAKKRGWLTTLIESQDRVTNNPGAQSDMSGTEITALLASDPVQAQRLLAEAQASIEAEKRKQAAVLANDSLLQASSRFRKAAGRVSADEARRLRVEAEQRMARIAAVDASIWPWAKLAERVREQVPFVSRAKRPWSPPPAFEGLRVRVRNSWGPSWIEIGPVVGSTLWVRRAGDLGASAEDLDGREGHWPPEVAVVPSDLDPADWPASDLADAIDKAHDLMRHDPLDPQLIRGWAGGSAAALWREIEREWRSAAARAGTSWRPRGAERHPEIPMVTPSGALELVGAAQSGRIAGELLGPTPAGWVTFLRLGEPVVERDGNGKRLSEVARTWFGRAGLPPGYVGRVLGTEEGTAT